MKKAIIIATSILLIFSSCCSTVRLAKKSAKASVQFASPTKAAVFVTKENVFAETDWEQHTETANVLYDKYGPATDRFLIGRTNAQTFIISNSKKRWYIDINKLKNPVAMILFDGYHKPFIEYNISKYEETIEKHIHLCTKGIDNTGEVDNANRNLTTADKKTFFLQSELTTNDNGSIEKKPYEILFFVKLLEKNKQDSLFYDREAPAYFENSSDLTNTYEVELYQIFLKLSGRLKKAEDFTRRLLYRYDWIQPKVNLEGQVVSIENKQELKETWQKIKKHIQNDYGGDVVDEHLEKLGLEFETDRSVYPALSQYYLFGLLFPAIPEAHGQTWERKRTIELSPYEEEQFEEQAVYIETIEGERIYNMKGSLLPGSQTELESFEGYMLVPVNQTLPVKVEINTSVKMDGIISQWHFNLEQY